MAMQLKEMMDRSNMLTGPKVVKEKENEKLE